MPEFVNSIDSKFIIAAEQAKLRMSSMVVEKALLGYLNFMRNRRKVKEAELITKV